MEDNDDDINSMVLKLDTLKNETGKIEAIKTLFDRIDKLSDKELETELLIPVLSLCRSLVLESLEKIENELKCSSTVDATQSASSSLGICLDVLQIILGIFLKIQQMKPREVSYVDSIPKNVSLILLNVFKHCQSSEATYGVYFSKMSELLKSLFRKAHDVQFVFLQLLHEAISFKCTLQCELDLLVEVMEILEEIGETVMELDVKTFAVQWKGYLEISEIYSKDLRMWLDVSRPIRFMANEAKTRLEKIASFIFVDNEFEERSKVLLKDLKVGNCLLKLLVNLLRLYKDCVGKCHTELMNLLISLNGFSAPYLSNYKLPEGIVHYIEINFTIGTGPVLTNLFCDKLFLEEFYRHCTNLAYNISDSKELRFVMRANKIGLILLTATIMKKVINSDEAIAQLWSNNELCLPSIMFQLVEHSEVEMNMDLKINRIEIPGTADIYEIIVSHTASYIIGTTMESNFRNIEDLLFSKLLQSKFWVALLASDILCLLARFGSNELRSDQVKNCISMLKAWPLNDYNCPEWVYLVRLTSRLIEMLPLQQSDSFLSENRLLTLTCGIENPSLKLNDCDVQNVCITIKNFLYSENEKKTVLFHDMIEKLNAIPYLPGIDEDMSGILIPYVLKLWHCCSCTYEKVKNASWLNNLVTSLSTATGVLLPFVHSNSLHQILKNFPQIIKLSSTSSKLSIVLFLQNLANIEIKSLSKVNQLEIFKLIAKIFCLLLQDKQLFIKLNALDTFKYFAEVTRYTQIISLTAKQSQSVEEIIKNYLQKDFCNHERLNVMDYENYLEELTKIKFKHKCNDLNFVNNIDDKLLVDSMEFVCNEQLISNTDKSNETLNNECILAINIIGNLKTNVLMLLDNYKSNPDPQIKQALTEITQLGEFIVDTLNKNKSEL